MSYCPDCRSEYQAGLETCAACGGTRLVESLPPDDVGELVEVFRCGDELGAERICTVVLGEIPTVVQVRGNRAFPTPAVNVGLVVVGVDAGQAARARQLLAEAIEDGVVGTSDGEIVTSTD